MHFTTRNVNTAFQSLVKLFNGDKYACSDHPGPSIIKRPTRNGAVMMIDEPVMITYEKPRERVLFNQARDCNPFFHVYEALWMLAGRNDVASLAYYASNMANYSDDEKTLNGAYGYRWRHADFTMTTETGGHGGINYDWTPVDQLNILVNHLKADPTSRRAVLQMWNVEDDLLKIGGVCPNCLGKKQVKNSMDGDAWGGTLLSNCIGCKGTGVTGASRDVCCNTSVMFSIRENPATITESGPFGPVHHAPSYLDMTVTNRSNDLIWGCLGANYVHFSFLQEYMASRIGVEVGKYTQMSNNLHVYESNWKPDEWLNDGYPDFYDKPGFPNRADWQPNWASVWRPGNFIPLVKDPATFEEELPRFVEQCGGEEWRKPLVIDETGINIAQKHNYTEPFLKDVAWPMMLAFRAHKYKGPDLYGVNAYIAVYLSNIKADDWRIVATNWITKRKERHEKAV